MGVRGALQAFVLTAVLAAVANPLSLHAQPPQQPAEPGAEEPADAQAPEPAEEQAPEADALADEPADEQPADTDAEQQPAEPGAEEPADALDEEQPAGTFVAPAGLVLSYVKSDGRADFERVMASLGAALAGSEDEELRALPDGWRLYRAQEPGPEGEVLYVWLIDPAVAGADYAVPELLGAALPDESQALFDAFSAAFGSGQALINLEPVDLGTSTPE